MHNFFKKITFLSLIFSVLIFSSCKKKKSEPEPAPTPYLDFKFGYFVGFNLVAYKNQTTIPMDSVKAHEFFGYSISEIDLPSSIKPSTSDLVFDMDVTTKNDQEHFKNGLNTPVNFLSVITWNLTEVSGEFGVPFKISPIAIKGNDTLEFSSAGDFFKVDYSSHQLDLKGSKTLTITP